MRRPRARRRRSNSSSTRDSRPRSSNDEPLLSAGVRLEILETVAGTDSEEVALTRVELLGYPAHGDDVALAEERAARLPAAGATLPA